MQTTRGVDFDRSQIVTAAAVRGDRFPVPAKQAFEGIPAKQHVARGRAAKCVDPAAGRLKIHADEPVVFDDHAIRRRNAIPAAPADAETVAGDPCCFRAQQNERPHRRGDVAVFNTDIGSGQTKCCGTTIRLVAHGIEALGKLGTLQMLHERRGADGDAPNFDVASVLPFYQGIDAKPDDIEVPLGIDGEVLDADMLEAGHQRVRRHLLVIPDKRHQITRLSAQCNAVGYDERAAQSVDAGQQKQASATLTADGLQRGIDPGGIVLACAF